MDILRTEPMPGRREKHSAALAPLLIQLVKKLARPVGRAVVHDDDLFLDLHGLYLRENLLDGRALVVDWHHDRELRLDAFRPITVRQRRASFPHFVLNQHKRLSFVTQNRNA
jgi:hypothetical protein